MSGGLMEIEKNIRCLVCGAWMNKHPKLFGVIVCYTCGHKEHERMNSVVEPAKEKRGGIASAWDRIARM
jgi:hypothetical protein